MSNIDHATRLQALDPCTSFIVQAPAGSGKTELLVQRYLTLLANAKMPEEILAITFTRKAAAEMRQRIIGALQNTSSPLAQAVLAREQNYGWEILNNPSRLRIQTIDALCQHLTQQMPILSRLGVNTETAKDALFYYEAAANALLGTLESEHSWVPALKQLLLHLDNDFSKAQQLFIAMLQKREQWLPHIVSDKSTQREVLETSLKHVVLDHLQACYDNVPDDLANELCEMADYAANQLSASDKDSTIKYCMGLSKIPDANFASVQQWTGLANLLLTKQSTGEYAWRKRVDKNLGFPSEPIHKPYKERMQNLLVQLTSCEIWRESLQDLLNSPAEYYSDEQWQLLATLIELLPLLVAQLALIFSDHNVVDFQEVAMAALRALGELDQPSDLALRLDYQIQHILVDEFQDTSLTQFQLLDKLTAGWQADDGRTLFLVGDPMQSIYRFRKAEVGLFLRAKQYGIGSISLVPLHLRANFRAQANLVTWINATFTNLFPQRENIATGAVTFFTCEATKEAASVQAVTIHPSYQRKEQGNNIQVEQLIQVIQQTQQASTTANIAILVRARTHLTALIPALTQAGIPFQSTEIIKLADYSIVQDLFALTRALLNLADRIAWFAILRAPWCGLSLADLHAIGIAQPERPLWEKLKEFGSIINLSADGKQRLQRVVAVLTRSLQQRGRLNLYDWVNSTWVALGGPTCISSNELVITKSYFDLLDHLAESNISKVELIEEHLNKKYTSSTQNTHANLQIMTIHKAKGLEFDVVLLPFLESTSKQDDDQLLQWLERPGAHGNDLIFAMIKAKGADQDSINKYIKWQEKQKSNFEMVRLLYVAATRAKQQLHLFGTVYIDDNPDMKFKEPVKGSVLKILWPVVQDIFEEKWSEPSLKTSTSISEQIPIPLLKRLPADWRLPYTEMAPLLIKDAIELREDTFSLESQLGTVIHLCIQKISNKVWQNEAEIITPEQQLLWKKWLLQAGITLNKIDECLAIIVTTLKQMITDPKGKWILQSHEEAQSEYALTAVLDEKVHHFIIDRTFVADGIRWIIDYKTTELPANQDIEEFLAQQQQLYWQQLYQYGLAMRLIDKRPIRLGLYFPQFGGWSEWEFVSDASNIDVTLKAIS